MNNKRLSIITINYNDAKGLKLTMDSVLGQTNQEFEYVVVDGASKDDSVAVIQSYNANNINWISEPDSGIYNAMNKGIERATGNYLLFLNSGDVFYDEKVLEDVFQYLDGTHSFVAGNLYYKKLNGTEIIRKHPEKLTFGYLAAKTVSHPSTFIKKDMFDLYGSYNEENKIVSDWEFFFKALALNGASFLSVDRIITNFDMNGISSSAEHHQMMLKEKEDVFKKHMGVIYNDDTEEFLFKNILEPSKRVKRLSKIEKSSFIRKVATVMLSFLSFFAKK